MSKGDIRCVDGRSMRHDPQHDDPDLETDVGACPECDGKGRNCWFCGEPHAEEWSYSENGNREHPICTNCADVAREAREADEATP